MTCVSNRMKHWKTPCTTDTTAKVTNTLKNFVRQDALPWFEDHSSITKTLRIEFLLCVAQANMLQYIATRTHIRMHLPSWSNLRMHTMLSDWITAGISEKASRTGSAPQVPHLHLTSYTQ
jgi:hypothetical protein